MRPTSSSPSSGAKSHRENGGVIDFASAKANLHGNGGSPENIIQMLENGEITEGEYAAYAEYYGYDPGYDESSAEPAEAGSPRFKFESDGTQLNTYSLGITIVIVTHQMEVVRKACNKACILEHGKIADEGTVKEIFIRQPESLQRLLGEERLQLPQTGHNIQIAHLVNGIQDGEFFGKMSKDLHYVFPILNGQIQEYQGDKMGIFVINVDDEHLEKVERYLDEKKMNWHELHANMTEKDEEGEE